MKLKIDSYTLCGPERSINQDAILLDSNIITEMGQTLEINLEERSIVIIAVADGMGGHKGGEVASRMVLAHMNLLAVNIQPEMDETLLVNIISNWIKELHQKIKRHGIDNPNLLGMGSTLTSLLFHPSGVYLIHAGDTKLYRFRNSMLVKLSRDHNLAGLTNNPLASKNILLNAIGPGESVIPDIENILKKILPGDKLLLCSDGLTDGLSDENIEEYLKSEKFNIAKFLVDQSIEKGSSDNSTAIIIDIV